MRGLRTLLKNVFLTTITYLLILFITPLLHAEYLRATKQDELILISTEQEIKMGDSLAKSVESRFNLADDSQLQLRVNDIGQDIAKICDRKDITYHFKVVLGEELKPEQRINAFALPGGYVYIFKDLLDKLENNDEIASVLAHEIGHIAAKHSIKRLQGSLGAMAFQILTTRIESDRETKNRAYDAITLLMLAYSREDEFTADVLGVKYTRLAGYNPEGAIKVIDKLIEIQRKAPIKTYSGYRTHPYLSERKAVIRKEIYGHMDFVDFINIPKN